MISPATDSTNSILLFQCPRSRVPSSSTFSVTGNTGFVSPLLVVPETLLSIPPGKQARCSVNCWEPWEESLPFLPLSANPQGNQRSGSRGISSPCLKNHIPTSHPFLVKAGDSCWDTHSTPLQEGSSDAEARMMLPRHRFSWVGACGHRRTHKAPGLSKFSLPPCNQPCWYQHALQFLYSGNSWKDGIFIDPQSHQFPLQELTLKKSSWLGVKIWYWKCSLFPAAKNESLWMFKSGI